MAVVGKKKKKWASGKLFLPGMTTLKSFRLWKRETPLERRLHSSVIKHLNEKPGDLPSVEMVNAVAHDLVMIYAKQVKVPHLYMPRVKRLATIEMTPEMRIDKKIARFKNIVGKRAKIPEAIREMDAIAHGFGDKSRLGDLYREEVLNKIKGPIYVKPKEGEPYKVEKDFLTELVKRASHQASIAIADINSTLRQHLGH